MNKKIFFIVLGALLILVLMIVMWFWFFGRHKAPANNTGSLGTPSDISGANGVGGNGGNDQTPLGDTAGSNAGTGNDQASTGNNAGTGGQFGTIGYTSLGYASSSYVHPGGVSWLDGSGGGGNGNGGFNFDNTPINSINSGSINGKPYIERGITGADGQNVSLLSSLGVLIGGCLVQYAAEQAVVAPAVTAVDTVVGSVGNFIAGLFGLNVAGATPANPQFVSDSGTHSSTATETVSQCLTRTLGRLAVQKITESTVDWINSGFDGQPAFVQDYNKFFTDVADEAAGNFIQGSDLAFLCSPFKLQIKIAIAQSYANRKSSSAGSCSLTQVVDNVDKFMKGDFSWGGLVSFATVPVNNPYGAYMYGQNALDNAVSYDVKNATLRISPGGFLSQQKCDAAGKNCVTVTPGSTIEASLETTLGADVQSLQLGDSIDQILGALSNALITKLLYSGLSNVSSQNDSPVDEKATSKADILMNSLRTGVTSAQKFAGIRQGTILDIQNTQQNLAGLADCWAKATTTANRTADQITQGNNGFADAVTKLTQLQTTVTQYNKDIATANTSIVSLQTLQTNLLLSTNASDVAAVQSDFNHFQTLSNNHLYTNIEVTSAQQDRTSQQNLLAQQDALTTTNLQQCYALGH